MMKSKCNCHKIGVSTLKISIFLQHKVLSNISAPDNAIKIPIFPTFTSIFSQQCYIKSKILNIPKNATNDGF